VRVTSGHKDMRELLFFSGIGLYAVRSMIGASRKQSSKKQKLNSLLLPLLLLLFCMYEKEPEEFIILTGRVEEERVQAKEM
jgi:hypothetical protein